MRKDKLIELNTIKNTLLEQAILFELEHPLLCGMHYCFQTPMNIFFVMPFIHGRNLKEFQRKFEEKDVKFIIYQIVFGIGYLHSRGIVHRDLKPDNIMVCRDTGYIKLIDFGLATVLKPGELSGALIGTTEYISPEMTTFNP